MFKTDVVVNQKQKAMLEFLINGFEEGVEQGSWKLGQLFECLTSVRFFEEETKLFNEISIELGLLDEEVSVSEAQKLHQYIANQEGIEYAILSSIGSIHFKNVKYVA
tara:strand:- start:964 stop:1284 length:321 start_codon:yes stop_codon:yes gene_type:complete